MQRNDNLFFVIKTFYIAGSTWSLTISRWYKLINDFHDVPYMKHSSYCKSNVFYRDNNSHVLQTVVWIKWKTFLEINRHPSSKICLCISNRSNADQITVFHWFIQHEKPVHYGVFKGKLIVIISISTFFLLYLPNENAN